MQLLICVSSERLTLPLWKSLHSLNLMLPKEERKAMLLRIFDDNSPLIDHSQQRKEAYTASSKTAEYSTVEGVEPETFVDQEDGGVKLNTDAMDDEDMDDVDATAPVGASGVGTEDDAIATEDRLRADQQVIADQDGEVAAAPEREVEEKAFNTTV